MVLALPLQPVRPMWARTYDETEPLSIAIAKTKRAERRWRVLAARAMGAMLVLDAFRPVDSDE